MRALLIVVLTGFIFSSQGQTKIYNNKINKVTNLKVYGNSKIEIGQIIVNQSNDNTKLYLKNAEQHKDSASGNYITTFTFANPQTSVVVGIKLQLNFDGPIISVTPTSGFSAMGTMEQYNPDKTEWNEQIGQLVMQDGYYTLQVTSKTPIKTNIYGVAGKM